MAIVASFLYIFGIDKPVHLYEHIIRFIWFVLAPQVCCTLIRQNEDEVSEPPKVLRLILNFILSPAPGKGGADVDLMLVSSVYGKGRDNVVRWVNNGNLRYVDKVKARNYLHLVAPIAAASDNNGLISAAKIIENFKNNK